MIEYPIIVCEIPHQMPCKVYSIENRHHLLNIFIELGRVDYEDNEKDEDLLEKLTHDNNRTLFLNHEEAKDLAFRKDQKIYEGHKQYELIDKLQDYLIQYGFLFD